MTALRSNIHTHSTYADGRDAPEDMLRAALRLGFHTLGFSEHGRADYDDCAMPADVEPLYRADILRLKAKYAGRIDVLLGYEHDWLSPPTPDRYDYIIESVHYLRAGGGFVCVDDTRDILTDAIDKHFGGDPYAMCREYFRTVAESCQSGAQVLGHMDLVMKFNERRDLFDDADSRYLKCALEAADAAADSGMLIEINTGAIARGYRTQPYPGPAILRRLAERGARIVVTSDCHNSDYLDCGFADAAALARGCGFRTAWQYRGAQLEEYPLEDIVNG
ncbi:MAG: histidinol-phosphatase [Clostridia bacterium]|nr:histidinol-phosphatase [Clostridia bacterium]